MVWRVGSAAVRASGRTARVLGRRMESTWKPAVQKGALPVYDEALAYVEADAAAQKARLQAVKQSNENAELADALEIASEINLSHIRSEFTSGTYDLRRPVFRHLREQAWRLGGSLDQLVERATLMNVLPDVVPEFTPTVDLQVLFGSGAGIGDHGGSGGDILPGIFLSPAQTRAAPQIIATAFHSDERKYTVMLVDPDSPSDVSETFQTYVHWLVQDVPLSASQSSLPASLNDVLPYIPPHPQQGTPYHRYTMLLFEQTAPVSLGEVPREQMDVTAFAAQHQLQLRGLHFWRARWTEANKKEVSAIYNDILQIPEPRYGYVPRQDKLKDALGVRHSKYY